MKMKITDLMDLYEEPNIRTVSDSGEKPAFTGKETTVVKETKKKFGWKEYLAMAAALAVVVLGGFGLKSILAKEPPIATNPTTVTMPDITTSETNPETTEPHPTGYDWSHIQPQINPLLTDFAEQGIMNSETDLAGEYEKAQFAHIYTKLYDRSAIEYREDGENGSFETLTLDQVNDVLDRLMGESVAPAEGTDYTEQRGDNYAQHESFHDGRFWWPAADGEQHTRFALGHVMDNDLHRGETGSFVCSVGFKVYDTKDPDADKYALLTLTIEEADAMVEAGKLTYVADGQAWIRFEYMHGTAQMEGYEQFDPSGSMEEADDALKAELKALFSDDSGWYARTLLGRFAWPDQVDLFELFYAGLLNGEDPDDSDKMEAFYAVYPEARQYYTGCDILPAEEIDKVLQQYLGVSLDQTTRKGLSKFTWLEQTGSYYHFHGDTNIAGTEIEEVRVRADGLILFTHAPANWPFPSMDEVPLWTTTLRKQDGRYVVLSNLPGQWVTGEDVGALSFLYDGSHAWRMETNTVVRELYVNENGSVTYREGDPNSEFSIWQSGGWWTENGGTLCIELWNTDEIGNRTGEPYAAAFTCALQDGDGNLLLTQTSPRGFHTDGSGKALEFHVIEWNDLP